jgi:hypothetical protein
MSPRPLALNLVLIVQLSERKVIMKCHPVAVAASTRNGGGFSLFATIFGLRERCPADVRDGNWNQAVGEILDGYLSMYSELHESEDARFAALDEVDSALQEPVGPKSLLKIWDQVSRHTEHQHRPRGLSYRERLLKCLKRCGLS